MLRVILAAAGMLLLSAQMLAAERIHRGPWAMNHYGQYLSSQGKSSDGGGVYVREPPAKHIAEHYRITAKERQKRR